MKTKATDVPIWDRRRPQFLFSGLMTCGGGGGFSKVSKDGFGCSTALIEKVELVPVSTEGVGG